MIRQAERHPSQTWPVPNGLAVAALVTAFALALAALPTAGAARVQATKNSSAADDTKSKKKKPPVGILERDPFYRLVLDAENDNAELDIQPVENVPANPKPGDRLRIRLLDDPTQLYEVEWRHIARLLTYDQLVFEETLKLVARKRYAEAFPYFKYLLDHTRVTPGLRRAVRDYLLANARTLVDQGRIDHGMAILEELHRRAPEFQQAEVAKTLARVADQLISDFVQHNDYRNARGVIARMKQQYGSLRIESLDRWQRKLIDTATQLKRQAEQRMAAGDLREAERLGRRMIAIWPTLPGALQLNDEIARKYPMLIVGVGETSIRDNPISLDNWAARRTGPLTQRTLLQFLGAGPEGGQYTCRLGDYSQSDDRRQLILELNPAPTPDGVQVTGYDVARQVIAMANPESSRYVPAWAALVQGVRVEDVFRMRVDLRHPHVLPESMLQFALDPPPGAHGISPSEGPYRRAKSDDSDTHFVVNSRYRFDQAQPPAEIVERYFEKSQDAISALRRGDIDAIDYLFPADVAGLRADKTLAVQQYQLPTIHVLIPNPHNPFLTSQTFRRALVYGINRQAILADELLGRNTMPGFQVVSGPFPIGTHDNDPVAYAYDTTITPRSYYPRLAAILRILARRELKEIAKKRGDEPPVEKPLVLGFPSNEVARVACQAIAQYLQVVGIECQLRALPPGITIDLAGDVDLLYAQVTMWEPVIDARRLLAPAGVAAVDNPYIGMALRRLDAAKNWRQVRTRLHDLHRIVHEQVAVVPLWQTVNFLVRSRRLEGARPQPLSFYQGVANWSVTMHSARTSK